MRKQTAKRARAARPTETRAQQTERLIGLLVEIRSALGPNGMLYQKLDAIFERLGGLLPGDR